MTDAAILTPASERELAGILASASADHRPVEVIGGGSKAGVGRPQRLTQKVSTEKLAGVIDYDPAELVLTVRAGERLDAIEALLAASNQMFAFEPFDFGPIFGRPAGASTIGGVVAAGLAGSRRLSAGNVRDHVLGFTAVSGSGDIFKAGGRVVKNVTGYDVSKLMTGSWGRLAVMTQMTLKVMPRPRTLLTLALRGLPTDRACHAIALVLRSQAELAAAGFAPDGAPDGRSLTALRLEGSAPSVEARARLVAGLIDGAGLLERLDPLEAQGFWTSLRDGSRLGRRSGDDVLWRISVPLSSGGGVAASLAGLGAKALLDWAGALVWALAPAETAANIRKIAEAAGGPAMMVGAPLNVRKTTPALHPETPGVAALSGRVKAAFDPNAILDPQRFSEAVR
jgi:glycolate oxidase FAD binding subunit